MNDLVERLRNDDDLKSRIEAADRIEELEAELNVSKISEGRMHHQLMDERGHNRGMVCNMCNSLERSICYEQKEKLEHKLSELTNEIVLVRGVSIPIEDLVK